MAEINVYNRYYSASLEYNGVERRGASILLISNSEAGNIKYDYAVSFFPHETDDDFRISYDAYFSKTAYQSSGRRSKKREQELLSNLETEIDNLAAEVGGKIFWDKPLSEERRG